MSAKAPNRDMPGFDIPPLPIEIMPWRTHDWTAAGHGIGNHQWVYRFPNDYGASVIKGSYTYGGPEGFYELAVIKFTPGTDDSDLTYDTPITSDVLGWQTLEDIAATLLKVAAL